MKKRIIIVLPLFVILSIYSLGKTVPTANTSAEVRANGADHKHNPYTLKIICPGGVSSCTHWTITSPNQPHYEIAWNLTPVYSEAPFNIDLYRKDNSSPVFVKRLFENVPSFQQSVIVGDTRLQDIKTGGTHYIIMRSTDNVISGRSNDFTIDIAANEILVTEPSPGTTWSYPIPDNLFKPYLISWSGGTPPYDIYLYFGTNLVKKLFHHVNVQPIGVSGMLLKGVKGGNKYTIEVRSTDGSVTGRSGTIMIKNNITTASVKPAIKPAIKIKTPFQFSQYKTGDSLVVKWNMNVNGNVRIQLYKWAGNMPGNAVKTLAEIPGSARRTNQFNWTEIPANIPSGDYCIRISTTDNRTFSHSKMFRINQIRRNSTRRL